MKRSQLFAVIGFLIGWGTPLGAIILRYLILGPSLSPLLFINQEWAQYSFFYWYMLIGTCLVLTITGYFLGRYEDLKNP